MFTALVVATVAKLCVVAGVIDVNTVGSGLKGSAVVVVTAGTVEETVVAEMREYFRCSSKR